ncbi:MAG: orotidine-5'-phosphate decarboxylase [Candidatus Omnitrophica bacterium]|nr:orotidine-5'-phosphate decarboxylase [Candidatus Omnitrophota bacterium]
MTPKERLIVALDVNTKERALGLVEKLKAEIKIFKIGSELFTSCGPSIVEEAVNAGAKIFLDLKFHDIPNTVRKAAIAATRLGVFIFNVHALGGSDMMKRAAEAAADEARRLKIAKPKIIAVTVLTSMDENSLKKIGINDNMEKQVLKLAKLAKDASLDGVVASPSEVRLIRRELGEEFIIVTPGVRPEWAAANDQKRVMTPKEAIDNGADFIVVGRPIIEASNPVIAARKIVEEINGST